MAINLYGYVDEPFTMRSQLDHETLSHGAMRMMDDIIDLELEKGEPDFGEDFERPRDEDIRSVEVTCGRKSAQL